ncbi:FmdB family zinc ribbon protein [Haliea sp. E17]|uniref:FmdB family zinc ribbon protein n=1 Tax=Haliea sp. E17 TaxID=3401576 RepID=UPI003AABD4CA
MPIYEYQCQGCGHQLEVIQKISEEPLVECPQCKQPLLKKLVSAAAFRLKGGGWYETDFKSGGKKKNLHGESAKSGGDSSDGGSKAAAGKSSEKSTTGGSEKTA